MPNDKKTTSTPYIKNYGLNWKRDDVRWGGSKDKNGLFGKEKDTKSASPINFNEQIGFYALYDKQTLIYFGQVGGKNHTSGNSQFTIHNSPFTIHKASA